MQTKKYITVSQAIKKARNRVVYPAIIVMMLVMATAIYIVASLDDSLISISLSITLMILSFIAFGAIMTVAGDKWKTWAYQHVDDVREFRKRATNNRFSVNIFPSKRHLSIKKERLKALNTVRERVINNTLKTVLDDDYSIPRKLEIKRSLFYYLVPLVFCVWICYKTTGRLMDGTSTEFIIDVILSVLSFIGISSFLIKLIQYPTLISISEEGIWNKRTGFQSWDMVDSFGFLDKRASGTTSGAYIAHHLYITFSPESGLDRKKKCDQLRHDVSK